MHEEMPRPVDGQMAGFQLWVNLPARLKMTRPRYQEIASARIPEVQRSDGTRIRVIAGMVDGVRGPVTEIAADPTYLDVSLPPGGLFTSPVDRGHMAFAYLYGELDGNATFEPDGQTLRPPKLVVFGDGDQIQIAAAGQSARFLLVSGKPLGEPIARYGPFVMNTAGEIQQALEDLRSGTFVWGTRQM